MASQQGSEGQKPSAVDSGLPPAEEKGQPGVGTGTFCPRSALPHSDTTRRRGAGSPGPRQDAP